MRDERVGALLIERIGKLLRDREPHIVGLITETDIIRKGVAEELDLTKHTVEQFMTTPMISVESTWPLEDVYDNDEGFWGSASLSLEGKDHCGAGFHSRFTCTSQRIIPYHVVCSLFLFSPFDC